MKFYDVEADFYDLFYFKFNSDIPMYRRFLCPRVLEVFTGTGRILAKLGPEYGVGLDLSEKMLSQARRNLEGMNVKLVRGDAREFSLGERFCLIIIGLNSLMMFPRDERIRILKRAAGHLESGGRVIVDLLNPYEMVEGIVHHGDTVEKDGVFYSRFFVPRWRGNHWEVLYFYDISNENSFKRLHSKLDLYPIYPEYLEDEVGEAGLRVDSLYGDYSLKPYDEDSERIIAVMVKDEGD